MLTNYFTFPLAILIDEYTFNKNNNLIKVISQFKIKDSECFTVCQHISFRKNRYYAFIYTSQIKVRQYVYQD